MNQGNILYTVKSGVGIITINRPEKANAFDFNLLDELYNSLIEADKDRKVKCILLKSTGEKIFSAGFDLSSSGLRSAEFSSKIFELGGKISQTMVLMKKPIIVQVKYKFSWINWNSTKRRFKTVYTIKTSGNSY